MKIKWSKTFATKQFFRKLVHKRRIFAVTNIQKTKTTYRHWESPALLNSIQNRNAIYNNDYTNIAIPMAYEELHFSSHPLTVHNSTEIDIDLNQFNDFSTVVSLQRCSENYTYAYRHHMCVCVWIKYRNVLSYCQPKYQTGITKYTYRNLISLILWCIIQRCNSIIICYLLLQIHV